MATTIQRDSESVIRSLPPGRSGGTTAPRCHEVGCASMHSSWHVRRIRVLRLPAMVCAVTVGLAVAGCGGSSKSGSTTTASSATGAASGTVSGRDGGFTTVIPTGFVNGLAALSGGPITLQYAALAPRVDGFRPNINVVRESAHGLSDAG